MKDIYIINLTQGKQTIVNSEDFARLSTMPWRYNNNGYAIQARCYVRPKAMHHFILDIPPGMTCDHINGDRLDNRRANLRVCTPSQNSKNRKKRKGARSIYKGLSWSERDQHWAVKIWVKGKNLHLGVFREELPAAKAYDAAAIVHYGQYAKLNFPPPTKDYKNVDTE